MDTKRVRIALIERDQRLVDLHRVTGISYNRLVRMLNGYCEPRPEEVDSIASFFGIPSEKLK